MATMLPTEPRPRARIGVGSEHPHYKWWALSCTSFGMLLATVNSGTLIIALPDLERALHSSLLQLVWVIIAYIIASTVLVMSAGRLSDLFGRKRAYVAGFVVFSLASLAAGFSSSGSELIGWRVLQGVGGALIFANASAIVTDAFPVDELGLAMGTNTMVAAVGLVIGPVLGGALVLLGWSWVFWFNVPLGVLGSIWAALVLRDVVRRDAERGLDVAGTLCCVLGLTTLTFALSKGGLSGWADSSVIGGLVIAAIFLPAWVLIERRSRAPMLDLTIFRNRLFAAAAAAAFINGLARFALTFLFVFYFQGPQRQDPIMAGLELAPMAAGMVVASPIAGRIADRHGSRMLAALGMLISAVALIGMTRLGVSTPYWQSAVWLALVGIGSGVFMSPNTAAMMAAVPAQRRGVASGARTMLQNMGAVLSISFVMAVITAAVPKNVLFSIFSGVTSGLDAEQLAPFIDNMHTALWSLAVVSLIGGVVSLMRPAHVREVAP
jgi:EmrB/QacA subfamily drug resistance transporter